MTLEEYNKLTELQKQITLKEIALKDNDIQHTYYKNHLKGNFGVCLANVKNGQSHFDGDIYRETTNFSITLSNEDSHDLITTIYNNKAEKLKAEINDLKSKFKR